MRRREALAHEHVVVQIVHDRLGGLPLGGFLLRGQPGFTLAGHFLVPREEVFEGFLELHFLFPGLSFCRCFNKKPTLSDIRLGCHLLTIHYLSNSRFGQHVSKYLLTLFT